MSEIKNKIITLSGEPVAGKSTVKKLLIEKYKSMGYKVHAISTGDMFRVIAIKEYRKMHPELSDKEINIADVQNDESFAKKRAEIDGLIDGLIAKKGKKINSKERPNDVYIIDSRLAWHNIPSSYAVRLTIDEKIAGMRVFYDESRGEEERYDTVEEAITKTRERKLGEISRYKQRYGVDLADPENYDLIIDTSYTNPDELAQVIINGEKSYENERYYPKTWASPAHFLPVQNPSQLTYRKIGNEETVEEICESIKKNGYEPAIGEIDIEESDGMLFIRDGNHRTFAALSAGLTILPYYSTKIKDGIIPINISELRYLGHLYDWIDGIRYYGGKIGNIEQLKNFDLKNISSIDKVPVARKALGLGELNGDCR